MKTLLIMRHAKSSWANSQLRDYDRPLNSRGQADAPAMGTLLKEKGMVPELILSSTAERAYTTAELVALASEYPRSIERRPRFYHAAPGVYLDELRQLDDQWQRVMVVGHNPGMSELVHLLTAVRDPFTTANIAQVELPIEQWAELNTRTRGTLVNLWRPRIPQE